jgi:hypothetical protein
LLALIPKKYKNNEEILKRVIQQLKKDAEMVQLSTSDWDKAQSLQEFDNSFSNQVSYLIENDFEQLTQLFYRVDVNELKIKERLFQLHGKDSGEFVANEVLSREFEKVIFKMQYSGELKDRENS